VLKILVSLLIALLLTTTGLRSDWQFFMPPLVLLVTLYWVMLGPSICGLGFAFSVGLVLDLLRDAPAGQHALAFCATVYLAQLLEYRVRHLGLAQQAVVAGILIQGCSLRLAHFHVVWGAMLAWPMVAFSLGRWHGRSW